MKRGFQKVLLDCLQRGVYPLEALYCDISQIQYVMANNYYELHITSEGGINRKEVMQTSGFTTRHKNYMLKLKREVIVRVLNCSSS